MVAVCLKCDLQERFLSPSLLPGTADGLLSIDDPKGDISTLYQMASLSSDSPYKLQVVKYALRKPSPSTLALLIARPGRAEIQGIPWQSGNSLWPGSSYKHVSKATRVRLGSSASGSQRDRCTLATTEDLEIGAGIGNMASECREKQGRCKGVQPSDGCLSKAIGLA